MQSVHELLKCVHCHKVLKSPIVLPCGDRLCQEHLNGQKQITCLVCSVEYEVDEANPFPLDKLLQNLTIEYGEMHAKAKGTFERHQVLLIEFENLIQDPFNYLYEYVAAIRNTVCLEKELDHLTDSQLDSLLNELDLFEEKRKINFDFGQFFRKKLEESRDLASKIEPHLTDYNENEKHWRRLNSDLSNDSLKIEYYIKHFKAAILDYNQLILVEPISTQARLEFKTDQVKFFFHLNVKK